MVELKKELPEIFEEFAEQRKNSFLAIKEVKEKEIPVVGVFCTYLPREIPILFLLKAREGTFSQRLSILLYSPTPPIYDHKSRYYTPDNIVAKNFIFANDNFQKSAYGSLLKGCHR